MTIDDETPHMICECCGVRPKSGPDNICSRCRESHIQRFAKRSDLLPPDRLKTRQIVQRMATLAFSAMFLSTIVIVWAALMLWFARWAF